MSCIERTRTTTEQRPKTPYSSTGARARQDQEPNSPAPDGSARAHTTVSWARRDHMPCEHQPIALQADVPLREVSHHDVQPIHVAWRAICPNRATKAWCGQDYPGSRRSDTPSASCSLRWCPCQCSPASMETLCESSRRANQGSE